MTQRLGALLAAMLALGAAAGCGADSEEEQVRDRVETYSEAIEQRDGAALCQLADPESIPAGEQEACMRAAARHLQADEELVEEGSGLEIDQVEVDGDAATVITAAGSTLDLVRRDGEWYVQIFD